MKKINKNDSNIIQIRDPYVEDQYFNIFTSMKIIKEKIYYYYDFESQVIVYDFENGRKETLDQGEGFVPVGIFSKEEKVVIVSFDDCKRKIKLTEYQGGKESSKKVLDLEEADSIYEVKLSGDFLAVRFNSIQSHKSGVAVFDVKDSGKKTIADVEGKIEITFSGKLFINTNVESLSTRSSIIAIPLEKLFELEEQELELEELRRSWDVSMEVKSKLDFEFVIEKCIDDRIYFWENFQDSETQNAMSRLHVYDDMTDGFGLMVPFRFNPEKIERRGKFLWIFTQKNNIYRYDFENRILDINPVKIDEMVDLEGLVNTSIGFLDDERIYIKAEHKQTVYLFVFEIGNRNSLEDVRYLGHVKLPLDGSYISVVSDKIIVQGRNTRIYDIDFNFNGFSDEE